MITKMSKITYGIVREEYIVGEETRISYGIAAFCDVKENGSATVLASLHDIAENRKMAEDMAEKCNKESYDPNMLIDLI